MSIITLPAGLPIGPGGGIEQLRYDLAEMSDASGDMAVRLGAPPRWSISIVAPSSLELADGAQWEALLLKLRGGINVLAAWDWIKPAPLGSARGAIVLAAGAAAGASTIQVSGATAAAGTPTLWAGDWLGIGLGFGSSQLVKVVETVELAGGAGAVVIEAPLRRAYAAGTVVTWDRPLAYYRRPPAARGAGWQYDMGQVQRGFALDAVEAWS